MVAEWLVLLGALAAGFALGALTIFVAGLRRRRPHEADAKPEVVRLDPPPEEEPIVTLEPIEDDAPAAEPGFDDHFGVSRHAPPAPTPRPPPAPAPARAPRGPPPRAPLPAPEPSTIPTEWAARATDAPLPPGHVRGVCSGCGTPLSVGPRRPLRIACPECGRTRLLA